MAEEVVLWDSKMNNEPGSDIDFGGIVYDVAGDQRLLTTDQNDFEPNLTAKDPEGNDDDDGLQLLINDLSDQHDETTEEIQVKPSNTQQSIKHTKKKTKYQRFEPINEEELQLNKLLFGDKEGLLKKFEKQVETVPTSLITNTNQNQNKKRKPAWHDSDDEETKVNDVFAKGRFQGPLATLNPSKLYKEYLNHKYEKSVETPKWADLDRQLNDSDSDDEILRTASEFVVNHKTELIPKDQLNYGRIKDINRATTPKSTGYVNSILFHPLSTVAMIGHNSGLVNLYAIDGKANKKLHNVMFEEYNILCMKLLPCGTEAIVGSNKKYFYTYDLLLAKEKRIFLPSMIRDMRLFQISPDGKYLVIGGQYGEVHLLEAKTKELIYTYKQEYYCTDLQFTNDSKKILTHSDKSQICIFDIRNERIEHYFEDNGCINGNTLCISPNNKMLATGSREGVCNLYNYDDIFINSPQPIKSIYNLQSAITGTVFNHSSEILALSSSYGNNALRLLHIQSGTVYRNFPDMMGKLGRIKCFEFSPNSGYMGLANTKNEVPLFRLHHYSNY